MKAKGLIRSALLVATFAISSVTFAGISSEHGGADHGSRGSSGADRSGGESNYDTDLQSAERSSQRHHRHGAPLYEVREGEPTSRNFDNQEELLRNHR